jgi:ATP-dependent RNA helicase MSS116
MGFQRDIGNILGRLPPPSTRHNLLFSATVSKDIRRIANDSLKEGYRDIDTVPANHIDTHLKIKQSYLVVPFKQQLSILYQTFEKHQKESPNSKIICFLPTTKIVQTCSEIFTRMGVPNYQIHSKLSQASRSKVSADFRMSRSSILFTTDVSARGVDYPGVTLVIQLGAPTSRDQYIHRIGRTGRAGNDGQALIILSPFEKNFLNHLNELPIKPELKINTVSDGHDSELQARFKKASSFLDIPSQTDLLASTVGYCNFI